MHLLERDAHLARLRELLPSAGRGSGHIALVAGEAGIGKTALIGAFAVEIPAHGRVLWGTCDPIDPPRPFAPVTDVAARVGGPLLSALEAGDRTRVFDAFLDVLRRPVSGPSILVLDDLHWADHATLDLLRVVGRRLRDLPVLVIGTYRDHDVEAGHPLRRALGDLPPNVVSVIPLQPLSPAAVGELAAGTGLDAGTLHDRTAGNPFYVSEVLASGTLEVPSTVRDAVLARVARLPAGARRVLGAAAVLGHRCDLEELQSVEPHGPSAVDACVARGILIQEGSAVSFRHAIAHEAVLDALTPAERLRLHRRALAILETRGVDAARLVHHAFGAGDDAAVLALAPIAGARAEALGASREAATHYANALGVAARSDERSRAAILEAYARAAADSDQVDAALRAQQDALGIWRHLGDRLRQGDGLQALSDYLWKGGDGARATEVATEAVAILETIEPPGHELARALAAEAQRWFIGNIDDRRAHAMARRAYDLAVALGDEPVALHALTTMGGLEIHLGDDAGWDTVNTSLERARAAGLAEHALRALTNLLEAARDMWRFDLADRYADQAREYLDRYDFDFYERLLTERLAELAFERGRWDEAEATVSSVLGLAVANPVRVRALTLIGLIAARRGNRGAWSRLDEALANVDWAETQELMPLLAARTEAAWLEGDNRRAIREAEVGLALPGLDAVGDRGWIEFAFWSWKAGALAEYPEALEPAYAAHSAGRHREAASAWAATGRPYQQAMALADSTDEGDLRAALDIFLELAAAPMARVVTGRLRALGATRIPRGPRGDTQRHPAGLTSREAEVLTLLGEDLTNAEIAERLVVSPKTVDHHVSAILRKLGVKSRAAAAEEARAGLPR